MRSERALKIDRTGPPPASSFAARRREENREHRRTLELAVEPQQGRRFTTQEVRWDVGIDRLTIEDVHLDECLDIAARIMEVLPYDRVEIDSVDHETLRYKVSDPTWRLTSIVFLKSSLRRLAADPGRAIKIEYLQRDLRWSTTGRRSFVYPSALRNVLSE